ncbi:MAG: hypothetical protein CO186_04250 [Zetaproteobacteria bacterium CG_4_9_14_3_um_filter_49_83]|nr:MAG: hypothetical protein AUJ56_05845 [Zetaproteobacteria bacterium CG1_02_49_23]PIQ31102.1 MAG: hypothetical protein COW62_10600 [Zetaproteobacteria bacterium CG17_big_fil_post_rev_8_21_14_2_50_50_13]PIV29879.1 MAG: hypothetical protein COS35_09680 [Zetaproteobacteria bacterium CG02_land_8_20_14_3_00_50_9]PIY56831.1 MAG: hypothetical protein COZ00_02135 [Zetaproteobacteria bacterium CG_4_10_14_0_8_um_filter_49_80]PJA35747.1 MAG: hypothetical protein CO186_04250 [Zetaproteobacteria bacterium
MIKSLTYQGTNETGKLSLNSKLPESCAFHRKTHQIMLLMFYYVVAAMLVVLRFAEINFVIICKK